MAIAKARAEESLQKAHENLQMQSEKLQSQSEEIQSQNEDLQAHTKKLRKLYETLHESEEHERARFEELSVLMDSVPAAVWLTRDLQAVHITGNRLFYEWIRLLEGVNASKSAPEGERPETFRMFKDGLEMLPKDIPVHVAATGSEVLNSEFDLVYPDGRIRYVFGNASP